MTTDPGAPAALIDRRLSGRHEDLQRAADRLAEDTARYAANLRNGRDTTAAARALADDATRLDRLATAIDAMREVHDTYRERT